MIAIIIGLLVFAFFIAVVIYGYAKGVENAQALAIMVSVLFAAGFFVGAGIFSL